MILIFDGQDKVGKTSLINEINKVTNYEHIIIDRGPTSYLVYDKLLKRNNFDRDFEYLRDLKDLEKINHLCIYLEATSEEIEKRLAAVNEKPVNGIQPSDFTEEFTDEIFNKAHHCNNTVCINTSYTNIEDSVKIILNSIEEVKNKKYKLLKLTYKENNSSPSIIKRDNLEYIECYPSYNSYSYQMLCDYFKENNITFDINVDKPYYEMLEHNLNHILHKRKLGLINDRQLVYTSHDCISYIQFVVIDDEEYDLIINQRSLDIQKHKYNDLHFFIEWSKNNNVKINTIQYNVLVPHMYF